MSDHIFRSSRTLPFPPEAIYQAFASAELLAAWWGPAGFTNTFAIFEFRPDGQWKFVMHGPDGADYPNESRFVELMPERKVVIRHDCAPFFTLTVTLTPVAGGTEVNWEQAFDDAQVAQAIRHIIEPANEQNLDRLTAVLQRTA